MEELPKELRYVTQSKSASCSNGNTDKKSWTRAWKQLGANKGRLFSSYNEPPKIPDSPKDAMKFLCRSWSPCSSDFLHTLSSSNVSSPRSAIGEKEEQEYKTEKALTNLTQSYKSSSNKKHCTTIDLTNTKERGKTLSTFLRSRKEKKRDDDRFNTSKLHVALSLTQLAAAVSSVVSNGSPEAQDMCMAVASAAALMTTVWAETAEVLGAQRNQVMSSINSGQAIRTPLDMVALTATAATCLRGAETLKSRALANLSWSQEILKAGAQICALMPSGQKEYKWVTVYLKQEELILSFKKKYFGGALTTTKEYKAINVIEETMEGQSCFCICLKTNKDGTIGVWRALRLMDPAVAQSYINWSLKWLANT